MNHKPSIKLVKTIDLAPHIFLPKIKMIKTKDLIFEKTPT